MALTNTQVELIFNANFGNTYNTALLGGYDEPEYIPKSVDGSAQIRYKLDYVQSALHEVAHWCVAGAKRRELTDYGYWYAPDGRSSTQQEEFYLVESRPQALEWLFSSVAGTSFRPSADNLSLNNGKFEPLPRYFVDQLKDHALNYLSEPDGSRFKVFIRELSKNSTEHLLSASEILEAPF